MAENPFKMEMLIHGTNLKNSSLLNVALRNKVKQTASFLCSLCLSLCYF
jgi:hypothetical protein